MDLLERAENNEGKDESTDGDEVAWFVECNDEPTPLEPQKTTQVVVFRIVNIPKLSEKACFHFHAGAAIIFSVSWILLITEFQSQR